MQVNEYSSIDDWQQWMLQYHDSKIHYDLEHILPLAKKLEITNFNIPVITVAGTNGKGTTCALIERVLQAAGYKTAVVSSPHIFNFNERLRLNSKPVANDLLCKAFVKLKSSLENQQNLTFYEFATFAILALLKSKEHNLDYIVLEVGLGGRLDAVNVVENDIAVITSIGMDHTEYLGDTLEKIATEKFGIVRENKIVVSGVDNCTIPKVNAKLYQIGRDFESESYTDDKNITIAKQVLSCIGINENLIHAELKDVCSNTKIQLLGRFQRIIKNGVEYVFDVAHNADSAKRLAYNLASNKPESCNRTIMLLAIGRTKQLLDILTPLLETGDLWYTADIGNVPSWSASEIESQLVDVGVAPAVVSGFDSIENAFGHISTIVEKGDRVVITGSFHTVRQALLVCNPDKTKWEEYF